MSYSGEWEHVNQDIRRIKTPSGWIVVTSVHLIVGGKDYHAISQPLEILDPNHEWIIKK